MSIKGIVSIVAVGIFAGSAILFLIGGLMIFSGSATGNTLMIESGWRLVGLGVVLFVLALGAWIVVRLSEEGSI